MNSKINPFMIRKDLLLRIVDLVTQAEGLLNDHLIDNTEEVFEELPNIDTARAALNEALDLIYDIDTARDMLNQRKEPND